MWLGSGCKLRVSGEQHRDDTTGKGWAWVGRGSTPAQPRRGPPTQPGGGTGRGWAGDGPEGVGWTSLAGPEPEPGIEWEGRGWGAANGLGR